MAIPVVSFGSLCKVQDVSVGSVFILPTQDKTVIAMMIGQSIEKRLIGWLSEPPHEDEKQFGIADSEFYAENVALVIDDAKFVLSKEPRHLLAWQNQRQPGIIVRTTSNTIISLGHDIRTRWHIDLTTGLSVKRPDVEDVAVVYTSCSLARRSEQDGRTVPVPICEWELAL